MWLSVGADYGTKVLWDEVIQVSYVRDGQVASHKKLKIFVIPFSLEQLS